VLVLVKGSEEAGGYGVVALGKVEVVVVKGDDVTVVDVA